MAQVTKSAFDVQNASVDQSLNQLLQQSQPPKQPGTFRRILGAAAGIAGNVFAPGLGGALGNLIGGGVGLGTASTDPNQFLRLAQQVNAQSEAFQAVSAVIKAKHDDAMAAINNIRG
jgi:hypothetical protein